MKRENSNLQQHPPAALRVDVARIKRDIRELAEIGRDVVSGGIYRMAFTDDDMIGKRWLLDRMSEAGLQCRLDGAANVIGVLQGTNDGPRIVIGSHIDTVPCAGALDGTLGVCAGLECLRRLMEDNVELSCTVELVAFSDEEGRFGGMLGSQAYCGRMTPERLETAVDLDGVRLWDAMERVGLLPVEVLEADRQPHEFCCYLELHIEQGPVLDRLQKSVGIVDEITGLFKWSVSLRGESNHAGTTPMDMRHDAFMGLADFAHEIPRILEENGSPRSRATIGRAHLLPGSANTVPGHVEFSLDVRDTNIEILRELSTACRKTLSAIARRRSLHFDFHEQSWIAPVGCHKSIVKTLQETAEAIGVSYEILPSGAAHDAQIVSQIMPVGMIFVPSRGGQSHSPAEWTSWHDIEAGANLLLATLTALATSPNSLHVQ